MSFWLSYIICGRCRTHLQFVRHSSSSSIRFRFGLFILCRCRLHVSNGSHSHVIRMKMRIESCIENVAGGFWAMKTSEMLVHSTKIANDTRSRARWSTRGPARRSLSTMEVGDRKQWVEKSEKSIVFDRMDHKVKDFYRNSAVHSHHSFSPRDPKSLDTFISRSEFIFLLSLRSDFCCFRTAMRAVCVCVWVQRRLSYCVSHRTHCETSACTVHAQERKKGNESLAETERTINLKLHQ